MNLEDFKKIAKDKFAKILIKERVLIKCRNIAFSSLNPQNWNLYAYAKLSPINYFDKGGNLAIRYKENQSEHWWFVKFETTAQKISSGGSKYAPPVIRKLLKIPRLAWFFVELAYERFKNFLVGPEKQWVKTDIESLKGIKGFNQGKFESEVLEKFKELGGGDAGVDNQISNKKPSRDVLSSVERLQKAIEEVLAEMIERGEITKEEAEEIKKVYNIIELMQKAKEASQEPKEPKEPPPKEPCPDKERGCK